VDAPNFNDLFRIGRDEVLARNAQLSREAVERDGSDANVIVASGAAIGDETVGVLVQVASGMFLDSATGTLLDRVVFDRYGLTRKPASPAVGSVVFATTAPVPGAFVIPSGTALSTPDGIEFTTLVDMTFLAGAVATAPVSVRSLLAGLAQQASIGTIKNIIGQIPGSPNDLTVNNLLATAGADDDESDDALRDRARRFYQNVRRGTRGAIESGAVSVAGVRTAKAFEVIDAFGRPSRYVQLAISDAFTESLATLTAVVPAYQAQSQVLAAQVFQALDEYRACGIYVDVVVAQVVLLPIHLRLSIAAGSDPDQVALEARAAVVTAVNGQQPGQNLPMSVIQNALKGIGGLIYTGTEIASPPGDIIATPLQAIRTSMGLVGAISTATDQPLVGTLNPDAKVKVS
jgi:uncharacterized phage protein gp47/JayE